MQSLQGDAGIVKLDFTDCAMLMCKMHAPQRGSTGSRATKCSEGPNRVRWYLLGGATHLRSQRGCLVLRTAVPCPVKQQLLVFREACQDINPVQLRQCQGVVGQPERPQSCHAFMRKQTPSSAPL